MTRELPVTIDVMSDSDFGALFSLKEQFRWNQTEDDLKRVFRLNPHGQFAAFDGSRMIGTITTILYGIDLSWIGMMMVDRDYRRRGIATKLLTTAIGYLRSLGVDNIRLDATPEGFPLYEAMGFVPESTVERWECSSLPDLSANVHPLEERFVPAIFELDKLAFGADRSMLLKSLLEESHASSRPLVSLSPSTNTLDGYALARRGSNAYYVGPVVAKNPESARNLLRGMRSQAGNQNVWFDFNTRFSNPTGYFPGEGFVHQRSLTRMSLDSTKDSGTSQLVFAIAGPELG